MPQQRFPIEIRARQRLPLGMPTERFLHDYWQKRPLLIRDAFPDFKLPLMPEDLAGLACMEGTLARIVTQGSPPHSSFRGCAPDRSPGRGTRNLLRMAPGEADSRSRLRRVRNDESWNVHTGPFDDETFAKLPKTHWALLVQDVDKWDDDDAALLLPFAFIPSWRIDDLMVSYATDGGGVGAHVDQYDVFLLQGMGQRRWAIDTRANAPKDFLDDVELKLLSKFSPTHEWTLEPGDMLYLPPGVPHDGVAIGECMTFSIGMRAPSAAEMFSDFAAFVAAQLREEQRYADPDLRYARDSGQIDEAAIARVMRTMPWVRFGDDKKQKHVGSLNGFARELPASMLRTWFGQFITRYRSTQAPQPRKRKTDPGKLDAQLERSAFVRDPLSRFAWCRDGRGAILFASGETYRCPLAWARALAGRERTIDGARLARLPERAEGVRLLANLIDAGHFTSRRS